MSWTSSVVAKPFRQRLCCECWLNALRASTNSIAHVRHPVRLVPHALQSMRMLNFFASGSFRPWCWFSAKLHTLYYLISHKVTGKILSRAKDFFWLKARSLFQQLCVQSCLSTRQGPFYAPIHPSRLPPRSQAYPPRQIRKSLPCLNLQRQSRARF